MAELVQINCPHCSQQIQAPNTPGIVLMCPLCQQRFTLGRPAGGAPPFVPPPPPAPSSTPPPPFGSFGGGWTPSTTAASGQVSPQTTENLRATRPWVLFLGILGFILCAFMLLGGIGFMAMASMGSGRGAVFPAFVGCFYLVFALLYLYPSYLLVSYGSAIGRFVQSQDIRDMERAIGIQKSFWKFVGILTIVSLAIGIIIGIISAIAGATIVQHAPQPGFGTY